MGGWTARSRSVGMMLPTWHLCPPALLSPTFEEAQEILIFCYLSSSRNLRSHIKAGRVAKCHGYIRVKRLASWGKKFGRPKWLAKTSHFWEDMCKNIARGTTDPWVETITGGTLQLANLVNINRWYHMHLFEIHPPGGVTCIRKKFGHQVAPLALVRNLATRWRQLH